MSKINIPFTLHGLIHESSFCDDEKNWLKFMRVKYADKQDIDGLTKRYPILVLILHTDYNKEILRNALTKCDYGRPWTVPVISANDAVTNYDYERTLIDVISETATYFHICVEFSKFKWVFTKEKYVGSIYCSSFKNITINPADFKWIVSKFENYELCEDYCPQCIRWVPLELIKHSKYYQKICELRSMYIVSNQDANIEHNYDPLQGWPKLKSNILTDIGDLLNNLYGLIDEYDPFRPLCKINRLIVIPGYKEITPVPAGYVELKIVKVHQEKPVRLLREYVIYIADVVSKPNKNAVCALFDKYLPNVDNPDQLDMVSDEQAEFSAKNKRKLIGLLYNVDL